MNAKRFGLALVAGCLCLCVAEQASAYYAAHMGRWTTRDPNGQMGRFGVETPPDSGMAAGFVDRDQFDPMAQYEGGMNLYEYVNSSPAMYTDPSGLLAPNPVVPIIFEEVAPVVCTPVGGAAAACVGTGVASTYVGYKVGQCTTGPLTTWIYDWFHQPCPPCPEPPKPRVDRTHDHGDCFKKTGSNTHWHYFVYDQNPDTCECFLRKIFGGCGEPTF